MDLAGNTLGSFRKKCLWHFPVTLKPLRGLVLSRALSFETTMERPIQGVVSMPSKREAKRQQVLSGAKRGRDGRGTKEIFGDVKRQEKLTPFRH
jgi:hypothetical protein